MKNLSLNHCQIIIVASIKKYLSLHIDAYSGRCRTVSLSFVGQFSGTNETVSERIKIRDYNISLVDVVRIARITDLKYCVFPLLSLMRRFNSDPRLQV